MIKVVQVQPDLTADIISQLRPQERNVNIAALAVVPREP